MRDLSFPRFSPCLLSNVFKSRNVLLSTLGLENLQILHHNDYDTIPLQEDDWDEEKVPEHYEYILSAITQVQKLYLIEQCKLSIIGKS